MDEPARLLHWIRPLGAISGVPICSITYAGLLDSCAIGVGVAPLACSFVERHPAPPHSEPRRETARQPGVVRVFGSYPSRARLRFYFDRVGTNTPRPGYSPAFNPTAGSLNNDAAIARSDAQPATYSS